jgi:hypothetical protein
MWGHLLVEREEDVSLLKEGRSELVELFLGIVLAMRAEDLL